MSVSIPCPRAFSIVAIDQAFDAVCLPSLEPVAFSMLAQECAALGLACFAKHLGANADAFGTQSSVQAIAPADPSAWAVSLEKWLNAFDRSRRPAMDAEVPLRIEEEAFFYEGLYRGLVFKRLH